jgi:hypothetical protein
MAWQHRRGNAMLVAPAVMPINVGEPMPNLLMVSSRRP